MDDSPKDLHWSLVCLEIYSTPDPKFHDNCQNIRVKLLIVNNDVWIKWCRRKFFRQKRIKTYQSTYLCNMRAINKTNLRIEYKKMDRQLPKASLPITTTSTQQVNSLPWRPLDYCWPLQPWWALTWPLPTSGLWTAPHWPLKGWTPSCFLARTLQVKL